MCRTLVFITIIAPLLFCRAVGAATVCVMLQEKPAQQARLDEAARLSRAVTDLYKAGKYDEAIPLAKRALEIREAALGPDDESVVGALINLGELYQAKKMYGDALGIFRRALAIEEKRPYPSDMAVGTFMAKLAFLYYLQQDVGKAESFYLRAISAKERAVGPDDLEIAKLLVTLGDLYRVTRRQKSAEETYERAVTIYGKKLGWTAPALQHALDRYSCLYTERGQYDKVKELTGRLSRAFDPNLRVVTEGVLNGKAVSLPKPVYPYEARRARVSGPVVLKVTIDETGKVVEALDLCGGHPLLVRAAVEAAREAKFPPTHLDGKAVKVTGLISYNFPGR